MRKSACSLCLVLCLLVESKLIPNNVQLGKIEFSNDLDTPEEVYMNDVLRVLPLDPVWVLDINEDNLEIKSLRASSNEEEDIFYAVIEPLQESLNNRVIQASSVKKDNPLKAGEASSQQLPQTVNITESGNTSKITNEKYEIVKIINKFILSSKEPDSYLTDINDIKLEPTLALYFKDQYSSMIVKDGNKEWHYVIAPPSPLPSWFYEGHPKYYYEGQDLRVDIPEDVKNNLYSPLLKMVTRFLSVPV